MISKIIASYLTKAPRLIIPDVGAFIARKESNEIIFMEMLKKNDGVLVGLVAESEGMSENEAQEIVNKYVLDIKLELSVNRKFIIKSLGVLSLDNAGVVSFTNDSFVKKIPNGECVDSQAEMPAQPQFRVEQGQRIRWVGEKTEPNVLVNTDFDVSPEEIREQLNDDDDLPKVKIYPIRKHKGVDFIAIIAIIAAIIAVASLIWGAFPNIADELQLYDYMIESTEQQTEQVE